MNCPLRQSACPEQCPGPIRFVFPDAPVATSVSICRIEATEQFLNNMKSFTGLMPVEIVSVVPDEVFMRQVSKTLRSGTVSAWRECVATQQEIDSLIASEPNVLDIRDRLKVS